MPKMYCQFTSFCTDDNCRCVHHHVKTERQLLFDILATSHEHMSLITAFKPVRGKIPCKFGIRCFEKDCPYSHSGVEDLEMRKIIFKQFNKQLKAIQMRNKISNEIKNIKEVKTDWNDL